LSGSIKVDVHYYEDGNVRMSTSKAVEVANASGADAVVREIAKAENKFQEELNRAFVQLAEGSFKGLRRQLPVTRQRVEWEKIGGYRVSFVLQTGGKDCVLTFRLARPGHRWWALEVGPHCR
jgi:capping protein alpha